MKTIRPEVGGRCGPKLGKKLFKNQIGMFSFILGCCHYWGLGRLLGKIGNEWACFRYLLK